MTSYKKLSSNLTLKYDGNNSVDAVELSTSILNFAKLLQKTSKDFLKDTQILKVDISAFDEEQEKMFYENIVKPYFNIEEKMWFEILEILRKK